MAKILVVYDSRSGNTEKMAMAIAEGVKEVRKVDAVVKKPVRQALKISLVPTES